MSNKNNIYLKYKSFVTIYNTVGLVEYSLGSVFFILKKLILLFLRFLFWMNAVLF